MIGFAGSVLKLRRTTAWLHGVGDMRANYVQYHGGGRHLHAKNPGGTDFSPVVTLDGMCLVVRRATYGPPRRSTGGRSPASTVTTSISRRPFSRRGVATTSAIRYSSSTSRPEPTPTAGSKRSKPTTPQWAGRLPLGVEPLDGARLADLDRRAEAYFLKLLCQKRLFGACPFRRIVRYIRAYPGRAASWALPFKYLKYHLKSLVRHG